MKTMKTSAINNMQNESRLSMGTLADDQQRRNRRRRRRHSEAGEAGVRLRFI